MEKNSQILKWDTDFFGFVVARIIPDRLTLVELEKVLLELKKETVSLVYWACDPSDLESQQSAKTFGGFLADTKVTYTINIKSISSLCSQVEHAAIERYTQSLPCPELEGLALKSGIYSRFNKDPKISKEQFERLYKHWIFNSVKKKGNSIFVAKHNNRIVGMVTLGQENNYGKIELIAVDEKMRGKKTGTSLLNVAIKFFVSRGCKMARVVTQADNMAGCSLYEKNGFNIEKTELFFHFWI